MFSFLKRRPDTNTQVSVSSIFALVCVSAFAYIIYLLRIEPKRETQKVELTAPPSTETSEVVSKTQLVISYLISAVLFALLIFGYFQLRQIIINYQNYAGNTRVVPESITQAVLWTFDSKNSLASNSVPVDRHLNNSHSLLIATDDYITPIYGWGVALAYPDLCKHKKGDPFQVNIVYVVKGTIKEFIKIPIIGYANDYNLSKRIGNVTVNVNVQLADNCKFSTVTAELTKK